MQKISACLVVRNEEKNISACLESIKDAADEIMVVHDGECNDNTVSICRRYTDRIFIRPYAGFMEAHLPFALGEASNDWILRIDADEALSCGLKDEIRNLAENDDVSAYEFIWPLWSGDRRLTGKWPHKTAMFRKSRASFIAFPHSLIAIDGKTAKTRLVLEHRPDYDNYSLSAYRSKWLKWAGLQAQSYAKDFKDIDKYNYNGRDWPFKIRLRKKFPLILIPMDFLSALLKTVFSPVSFFEIVIKAKVAFLTACYRSAVDYYLFKCLK